MHGYQRCYGDLVEVTVDIWQIWHGVPAYYRAYPAFASIRFAYSQRDGQAELS